MTESIEVARNPKMDASWRTHLLAAGAGVLMGLVLGYLGWVLPTPGGSLVTPTLVVAGVGAALVIGGTAVALAIPHRLEAVTFAGVVLIFTLFASVWTYQYSLPAQMAWDSTATARAKAILFGMNHGNLNATVPPRPCTEVTTGSIGPLQAPYEECATSTAEGHFVTFYRDGDPEKGISYTDRATETLLDVCYKHLVGFWYMFTRADLSDPESPCGVGYDFNGGP